MNKNTAIWVMFAFALLIVGIFIGRAGTPKANNAQNSPQVTTNTKPINMTVQATTPSTITVADGISASGVISAKESAEVSGKLTGATIERVLVDVGDVVKAGQVLAVLDNSTMRENVAQAQADYEQIMASVAQAKADLARVEPLLAIDAVSRQQVDSYRTTLRQAQATAKASLARLNTAKNNLNNTQIIAPVSGVISTKNAQVGMAVSGTSLFSIIKGGQLEWQATLSPTDAERISVGQSVAVAVGNESVVGQVTHLSPTANSGREIIVHVALPAHSSLRAGMYQRGQFTLGSRTHHAIPSSAVMSTDGYDYVWLLTPYEGKDAPSQNNKSIYQINRQRTQIFAREQDKVATDLPKDSLIVANGVSFLNEGDLVNVVIISEIAQANESDKAVNP